MYNNTDMTPEPLPDTAIPRPLMAMLAIPWMIAQTLPYPIQFHAPFSNYSCAGPEFLFVMLFWFAVAQVLWLLLNRRHSYARIRLYLNLGYIVGFIIIGRWAWFARNGW